jgi:hypothetical protein
MFIPHSKPLSKKLKTKKIEAKAFCTAWEKSIIMNQKTEEFSSICANISSRVKANCRHLSRNVYYVPGTGLHLTLSHRCELIELRFTNSDRMHLWTYRWALNQEPTINEGGSQLHKSVHLDEWYKFVFNWIPILPEADTQCFCPNCNRPNTGPARVLYCK